MVCTMRMMLFFDGRYPRRAWPVLAEYIRPNEYPRKSNSPSGTLQIRVLSSLTVSFSFPYQKSENVWSRPILDGVQPRDNPGYVKNERRCSRLYEPKTLNFSALCGPVTGFGTQGS